MFTDHKNGSARGRAVESGASSCFGGKWAPELRSLDPGAMLPTAAPHCPSREKRPAGSTLSVLWAVPESSLICLSQGETSEQAVTGFSSMWSTQAAFQKRSRCPDLRAALSPPSPPGSVSAAGWETPRKTKLAVLCCPEGSMREVGKRPPWFRIPQ